MIIIYHNPKCKFSRKCLKFLETKQDNEFEVKHHTDDISSEKLREVIEKLDCKPIDIVKKGNLLWVTSFKGLSFTDEELIDLIVEYPSLIKNPIVINGNKAVIGRPPETILNVI